MSKKIIEQIYLFFLLFFQIKKLNLHFEKNLLIWQNKM